MNWIERLLRKIDDLQRQHDVFGFPVGVVKKFGDDKGGKHAALLAYYGFVSLFPLLLVLATVMAYVLEGDQALQQRVIDTAVAQFPVLGPQLQGTIGAIQGSGVGLAVGVIGTLWGGLGITQTAQDAMMRCGTCRGAIDPVSCFGWRAAGAPWWSPPRRCSAPRRSPVLAQPGRGSRGRCCRWQGRCC